MSYEEAMFAIPEKSLTPDEMRAELLKMVQNDDHHDRGIFLTGYIAGLAHAMSFCHAEGDSSMLLKLFGEYMDRNAEFKQKGWLTY
jgi:hypothetical protein